MTNRVPSSPRSQQARPGQAQQSRPSSQAQRVRRPRTLEKMKAVKVGGAAAESSEAPEVGLWSGRDYDKSLAEVSLADVENLTHEQASAEDAQAKKAEEHELELGEQVEREETGGKPKGTAGEKPGAAGAEKAQRQAGAQAKPQQQAATGKQAALSPGATGKQAALPQATTGKQAALSQAAQGATRSEVQARTAALSGTGFSNLGATGQVQQANRLQGTMVRAERPPDAFALLREARPKGGFFVEDALREGHAEEKEDPDLAAAVEECIRVCFGVRGILRIGAGKNDKAEPVIVVVATTGFSEGSLAAVPQKVHRFPTLLAIPFELLPLRRER